MQYILENEKARLVVDTFAAEIHSFVLKEDGKERMWQGLEEHWKGRNPILFPQVGSTYNKQMDFKGKIYTMGNHGFCRNKEFAFQSQSENELVLVLKDDEETYAMYPFHFTLEVHYILKGSKVEIVYVITNLDEEVMPFGFGLHPAFNADIDQETWWVEFDAFEKEDTEELREIKDRKLYLSRALFDKYPTVVYNKLDSTYVTLTNGSEKVKVSIMGYPILAIWSKPNAPFVCIEPWHSCGDKEENPIPFAQREGIISLGSKKSFTTSYTIEIA